ncbi:hypothetical protein OBBRIDRAFT_807503 [Obba rivulosa]|uniref:Uncharacterized protein n=1 Tax=Obba rivulosa TaxID=1052685 RepID=A0A8E2DH39_9APHY|nr:hypothetical protein OBBRIDRAFT_807503 [Obba rivulosa]
MKTPFQSEFPLPGRNKSEHARKKALITIALALGTGSNPRGLEYYWYGAWGRILHDLVEDILPILVAPQFYIFVGTDEKSRLELIRKNQDGGDVPLGSPDSYHEAPEKHLIVDFAMLNTRVRIEPSFDGDESGDIHVKYLRIPMLVECKPRPSRNQPSSRLKKALATALMEAREDLYDQAALLFHAFPYQRSVVAVAASGDWWMYGQWDRDWVIYEWSGSQGQTSDEDQDDEKKDPTYIPPGGSYQDQMQTAKDDDIYVPHGDLVAAAPEEDPMFEDSPATGGNALLTEPLEGLRDVDSVDVRGFKTLFMRATGIASG